MSQNRSSAVMAQRIEPHDSFDDFPTPPWATRALFEKMHDFGRPLIGVLRDPAANRGHMVRPLSELGAAFAIEAADIFDYGAGFEIADYLFGADLASVDWTVTNPPFRLALPFLDRALATSRFGVAFLVRLSWLEGCERHAGIFSKRPPALVMPFAERVIIQKGKLLDPARDYPHKDKKTGEIVMRKPSTATAYVWCVWLQDHMDHVRWHDDTRMRWIGPCRKRLERAGDYPVDPAGLAEIPGEDWVCGMTRNALSGAFSMLSGGEA